MKNNVGLFAGVADKLLNTPDDLLVRKFGKYKGHRFLRGELRVIKNQLKEDEMKKEPVSSQIQKQKQKDELSEANKVNKQLIRENARLEKERNAILKIKASKSSYSIKPSDTKSIEAVAVIVASDWHTEEIVKASSVNFLNTFNLAVAEGRIDNFFKNAVKLLSIGNTDTVIKKVILALLGDFISGNIHEELLENTSLRPVEAIIWVQQRLVAGIKYFLANTPYDFVVVCHSGNHARITDKTHISTESGNSLEFFMYNNLREIFSKEKRITFIIPEGYHSYVDVFGNMIRFHHGHGIKYGGGIGGIFIPTYKAISQWNKGKIATLDVFGHYHQLKNGGNFICNGSLIGYNSYAIKIKADFERPFQKFFMITSSGIVIGEYPIFLD